MTRKLALAMSTVVVTLCACDAGRFRLVGVEQELDAGLPTSGTGGGATTSGDPCGIEYSACSFYPGDAGQEPVTPKAWAKTFFSTNSYGADVIVDPTGDLVVAGIIVSAVVPDTPFNFKEPPVDFGSGPIEVDHPRPFVVKFAADGKLRWARIFEAFEAPLHGAGDIFGWTRMAISSDGTIVVAGATMPDRNDFISSDFFLASLTPAGTIRWVKQGVSELKNHQVSAIEVDSQGAIWVAGAQNTFPTHAVVAKFSMDTGSLLHAFQANNMVVSSIAALGDQGVILGCGFNEIVKLDPAPAIVSANLETYDACLIRLNADAVPVWGRNYGTAGGQYVAGVKPDGQGGVFAYGWFAGTLTGLGDLVSATDNEVDNPFLARVSGDGAMLWSKALTGRQPIASYNLLTVDDQKNVTLGLQSALGGRDVSPTVTLNTFTPLGEPVLGKTYTDGLDLYSVSRRGSITAMGGANREDRTGILGLDPDPAGNRYFIAYFPQ